MNLPFVSTVITLRLKKDVSDPLLLFGMKKNFEKVFRRLSGCPASDCDGCGLSACAYHDTFARIISTDPAAVKKFQKPSLPFSFSFPQLPSFPNRGSECAVELLLLGSALNHFSLYISAVRTLIAEEFNSVLSITDIATVDLLGTRQSLMDHHGIVLTENMQILTFSDLQQVCLPSHEIRITLRSPLLILSDGKPLKRLDFSFLIRPLLRRISSLAFYYGGCEMSCDFGWLAEESTRIESVSDAIRWTRWGAGGNRGGMAGLGGTCVFRGNLTEFYPFLLFGQYVHVGKNASFGCGWYKLDANPAYP